MPGGFITISQYGELPPLKSGMPISYFNFPDSIYYNTTALNQLRIFQIVMKKAPLEKAIMVSSSTIPECLAIVAISLWRRSRQPVVILFGDMFGGKSRVKRWVLQRLIGLMDRTVDGYIVQSTEEQSLFPKLWGVDPSKMRVSLFGYTFHDDTINDAEIKQGDYIFAGGNTQRDYHTLLEVARRMPEHRFVFATYLLQGRADIPPNVTAEPVSKERYQQLMEQAGLVITPIQRGLMRASGQQTYLNAMRLGKISIVNEKGVLGVHDYIEHGKTGILVEGTPESYIEALKWVYDPQNADQVKRICTEAQRVAKERFTYGHFLRGVSAAVDDIIRTSTKPILKA